MELDRDEDKDDNDVDYRWMYTKIHKHHSFYMHISLLSHKQPNFIISHQ